MTLAALSLRIKQIRNSYPVLGAGVNTGKRGFNFAEFVTVVYAHLLVYSGALERNHHLMDAIFYSTLPHGQIKYDYLANKQSENRWKAGCKEH